MANPIEFQPKKVDPRFELQRRLEAAPMQHAEALLVAYELLDEAHSQGVLDLLHGAIGSKEAILHKLAEYARQPESVAAMRNLIAMGKVLGSITLDRPQPPAKPTRPQSLWRIFRRLTSQDGRRGLEWITSVVLALGRARR